MYIREEFLFVFINPTTTSPYMTAECTICGEPYSSSPDKCAVTFSDKESCNHVFCQTCITKWLRTKGVNSCPICRRQLFTLDDEDYDDFDNWDEEEEEREAEVFFTHEQIMEMLEDIWYKVYWMVDEHRQSVVREGRGVSEDEEEEEVESEDDDDDDEDDDDKEDDEDESATKPPLHTSTLLHSFMRILASRGDLHDLNDATGFASGMKINVLSCILHRIMAEHIKYIESTGGKEKVLEFPWEKAAEWAAPLRWIMRRI